MNVWAQQSLVIVIVHGTLLFAFHRRADWWLDDELFLFVTTTTAAATIPITIKCMHLFAHMSKALQPSRSYLLQNQVELQRRSGRWNFPRRERARDEHDTHSGCTLSSALIILKNDCGPAAFDKINGLLTRFAYAPRSHHHDADGPLLCVQSQLRQRRLRWCGIHCLSLFGAVLFRLFRITMRMALVFRVRNSFIK